MKIYIRLYTFTVLFAELIKPQKILVYINISEVKIDFEWRQAFFENVLNS